ncbi:MAG: hypothetical protein KAG14_04915, partial [Mycoplasmataceae bacterium]|nr:hypothetical protein [Mycoplasmataceae bacterium]
NVEKTYDKDDFGSPSSHPSSTSINSKEFKDDLIKATKLQFKIRTNVKYVDSNGTVKGTVVPGDIWTNLKKIGLFFNKGFRNKHGGSAVQDIASDHLMNTQYKNQEAADTLFSKKLLNKFGIKNNQWGALEDDKKQTLIDEVNGTVNFEFNKSSFLTSSFFKDIIARRTYFAAKRTSSLLSSGTLAQKYKIYNRNINDYESTGKYHLSLNDPKNISFKRNENYFDQKFISSKHNIKSITYTYQTEGDDFKRVLFQDFKEGTTVGSSIDGISYKSMLGAQKREVEYTSNEFSPMYIKGFTNKNILTSGSYSGWNVFGLSMSVKDPSTLKYYANENYYKLITGHTLTELLAGTDDGSMTESLVGRGASFRNLLNASINKAAVTSQKNGGGNTAQAYASLWAPELEVSTKTGDFHPVDESEINSVKAHYKNETVVVTPSEWAKSLTEITDPLEQLKAPLDKFIKMQKMVGDMLDDAGIHKDEKVTFEIPFGNVSSFYTKPYYSATMRRIMKVWRQLDP